jgi:2-amino-4-hydroxy-6-hydroxymethyldihydropteridine diphosphokinase
LVDKLDGMDEKQDVYIGLGSNIGDRKKNLDLAIYELEKAFSCKAKCSKVFQTEAWGFVTKDLFLNCCVIIQTDFPPEQVLSVTQSIEKKLGRVKKSKNNSYESRVIDLDILYYGELILNSENLIIPHPLIYDRIFVITTIVDVNPAFIDPVKNMCISQLLNTCNDEKSVLLYEQ